MRKILIATASLLAFSTASFAQDELSANTVVATVNGSEITLGHIIALTARLPTQYETVPEEELFTGILDQLIQQELLAPESDVTETALRIMIENEERTIHAEAALNKIATEAVVEDKIQAAYEAQIEGVEPEPQYLASHILLETEEKADEVLALAQADGADFAALAVEHSTGPSGPQGGDLGWFGQGAMVPEFDLAVQSMSAGDVVGPIKTQFGFHIIKLFETRDYVPSLDELRLDIENTLRRAAIDAKIGELENAATIERPEVAFDFEAIRNRALLDQ